MHFVTGNDKKWKEICEIFPGVFERSTIDLPELQGASLKEIAIAKARIAHEEIKRSVNGKRVEVVVEDTALCFDAMGELPGPYIKWFLESIGPSGLCRMLDGFASRTARAICTLVLIDSEERVHVFQGITPGCIAREPQGEHLFGWDPIFIPSDFGRNVMEQGKLSYAQMTVEEKNRISHRSRALAQLREYLGSVKRN